MKRIYVFLTIILLVVTLCVSVSFGIHGKNDVLFQLSTISELKKGAYDGGTTFKQIKEHGDFGLGTFNKLDGEMIGLDGKFYQIKADGIAYDVSDSTKTPFAVVKFFKADKTLSVDKVMDHDQLIKYLDKVLPAKNLFYAIKIKGNFKYIKTRSVPKQKKPYPPLAEVIKNQPIFEFHNIRGTIVGFWFPQYMKELNVPAYHFHFITKDLKAGGHLLDCQIKNVKIEIDYANEFYMVLLKEEGEE